MNVVILGGGESGVGAAILAKKKNHDVFLSDFGRIDKKFKSELIKYKVDFEEGQHSFERLVKADVVIKSPGIPERSPVMVQLREMKMNVISEIEWASRHTSSKIVAITGSNGKTTTTNLCAHLLKCAGYDAIAVGNVGLSVSRFLADNSADYLVMELSSFQLDDIKNFRPDIAILLNITPDHLDRYQDFQAYALSKWRIAENQKKSDHLILVASEVISSLLENVKVNSTLHLLKDSEAKVDGINYQGERIQYDNIFLRGPHNAQNVWCALQAMSLIGLTKEQVEEGLNSFVNDPHRLEEVVIWNEIQVINDSKATNVDSTEKALSSFDPPIVWMAGGTDKGNDYSKLFPLVEGKVKALIALGADNKKLLTAFEGKIDLIEDVQDLNLAVKLAFQYSRAGYTILFSPACASFDLFENYIDRGNRFKQAVKDYIK